jgi:hypothetical protein
MESISSKINETEELVSSERLLENIKHKTD